MPEGHVPLEVSKLIDEQLMAQIGAYDPDDVDADLLLHSYRPEDHRVAVTLA